MGISYSPKAVTSGLIECWDANNIKTYSGPAIQNLATGISYNNSSATGISISGGYETVDVPQLGLSNTTFSNIQNNYNVHSPNSNDCCPSPIGGYGNFVVTPSTLYTYAIVYKSQPGYTHPNFMYRYEYASNGGAYVTEGGVHNDSNRVHLGDGWYWAWGTFTTNASTNWIQYAGSYWYRYSQAVEKLSVARVLIVKGNHTGLHPRFWPATNTTRSTTQAVRDLFGTTTTTIDVTYSSNGSFTFDGLKSRIHLDSASDRFSWTPSGSGLNNATFETWIKTSDTNTSIISKPWNGNGEYNYRFGAATTLLQIGAQSYTGSYTSLATGQWSHIVWILTPTQLGVYKNGAIHSAFANHSITTNTPTSGNQNIPLCLMSLYPYSAGWEGNTGFSVEGDMSMLKIYNRQLTAQEVLQNFNATRGRYGV